MGVALRVPQPVSNAAVDNLVKQLNIGSANQIPKLMLTGHVFMIFDLHLRVPHMMKKLV